MATRDLSVRFTTSGFDDLRKQLSSAGKSFDEALKKAKDASQQAIADARQAAGDTQALEEAQKAFERAARQANNAVAGSFRELRIKSTADIEAQKVAAISAYEAIEKSGTASAQDIANAKAALKRTLEALDDQLDQTNGKVGRLGEGFTILKGVLANLISSGIQAGLSAIANTIQSLTQGVIGFGKASVGAFMSFDGAMKAFAAKSGGATEEQIRAVREETEKLGMATSKTPTQIAQMAASLAGAGFSAQETKDALGGIVMASEATGESLETVGDIVGAAINQFRLNAADSGYIADVLTAGANASATSISGLGEGLKYIGAIAGGANQNIEDMTIVLGLLTNAGLEAGQAGRNFASAFERIANASAGISDGTNEGTAALKAQQKALHKLGVQFRQADGQMRPFLEVLPELAEQYNKLSFGDQDLIRKQLFGTEGGRALVALLSQVETKLGSVTDAVRNSAGAAGDASEQLMKGLGPAIELLQSSMEVLQKNLGEAIAPAFEFLVRATTGWVNELIKTEGILDPIKNLSEEIKGFFEQNPAIIETINREMSALVQDALNAAVDLAQQLFSFLKENPTAIADLIRQTVTFVGGVLKTTVNLAQTLLNYFRENQGTIGKMGDALGTVWRALSTINSLMGTYMRPIINWAFTMIQGIGLMLLDIVDKIGDAINLVKSAWNWSQGKGFQSGGQQPGNNVATGNTMGGGNQMFFPTARGNIGTSPGQKFTARRTGGRQHNGIDITAHQGEPVHAVVGGRVTEIRVLDAAVNSHGIHIAGNDGNTWTYNHVVPTQGLEVGSVIGNGAQIAKVSADDKLSQGAHLDVKVKNSRGQFFDPTSMLSKLPRPTPENLQRAQSQTAIASGAMSSGGGMVAGGAAPKLTLKERQDLIQMMAAEATGEGVAGMAAVGRAILNRSALIASGVAPKGTGGYGAKSASVSDVIRGKNASGNWEFSPMGDGRFNKQFSADVMAQAEQAFNVLLDTNALKGLGLSDATINSPNFQRYNLRTPGWWQGGFTRVGDHHFGRDKFSANRNVSEIVAKTFTTESGVTPATPVSFTHPSGAAVNPMATPAETAAAKAEADLEKVREQSRQQALKRREKEQQIKDQEAIAVLKDQHEIRLEEMRRNQADELDIKQEQAKQSLELRRLETSQAIAQLKKERAGIEAERAKKLKTPVAQQTPEQQAADYSAEIKLVDLQIQQQEKSLKRTTDKINREFIAIAEDRAKTESRKQIDEYVRLGESRLTVESQRLDLAQANNEISQAELTYRRSVIEAARKQLEIDRLSQQLGAGLIERDQIEPTEQRIATLREELKISQQIADVNYNRTTLERQQQESSQLSQFAIDQQKRRLDLAEQTGQITQENLIVERANLEIAGKQLEIQQAIAALELGVTPEQRQVLELRVQTLTDEIQQTQVLTEHQLEQLEIQKEQLSYQADYEQISRLIEVAEREGNFERAESLKLLQAQYDLQTKIAEIKQRGLNPEQEAQAIATETRLYELNKDDILNGNRDMGESFRELLGGPMSEFFQGATNGAKSLSDAFNAMAQSILGSLSRVGAELATNSLLNLMGLGKPQRMQGLGGAIAGMLRGEMEQTTMATVGGGMFGDGVGLAESVVAGFSGVVPANNLAFAPSIVNSPQAFTGMVEPAIAIASGDVTQALSTLTTTVADSSNSLTENFVQSILDSSTTQTATTTEFVTSLQIARNAVISFAQSLPGAATVAGGNGGGILGTLAKGTIGAIGGALTGGFGGFTAGNAAAGLSTASAVASGSFGEFVPMPAFKYGGAVEKLSTVQTFKDGGEVKEIATYKDGGMVEKLFPVPTFANGGKVDPLRTAIASAFKKEGSGAMLAVMHSGEHVLSDRQGEAQTYRTLEKHFGKNPLSKISLPAFKYGGEVEKLSTVQSFKEGGEIKEIATYKDGGMVKKLSAFIPSYRDGGKISIPTFMNGGAVGSVESRLLSGLNSTRMPPISLPTENRRSPVTAGPVSNTVNVNINDRESRFYRQSRTLARDLADQLRS